MLARPRTRMPVEDELFPVGRVVPGRAAVHREQLLLAAGDGNLVQRGDARKRAVAARRSEDHARRIARPADDVVAAGVIREPSRRAAGGGHDEHVVVAEAIRREGDPAPVGREAREHIARDVVGEPDDAGAVLARGPDVPHVAEGDRPGVVVGVTRELDRPRRGAFGRRPGARALLLRIGPCRAQSPREHYGQTDDDSRFACHGHPPDRPDTTPAPACLAPPALR